MAKFKFELELQGLKIKMDGEREDIPLMAQNLGQQLAGLLEPAENMASGDVPRKQVANESQPSSELESKPGKAKRRRRRANQPDGGSPNTGNGSSVLNWQHQPEKWGNPMQGWSTAEKCLWLLYVVEQELQATEVSGPALAATFNQHFKQAKKVHPPNVTRDLGKLKLKAPSEVGENTTVSPTAWYLTDAGKSRAVSLVESALGKSAAAS